MARLHEHGHIGDPRSTAKSVPLTDEGRHARRAAVPRPLRTRHGRRVGGHVGERRLATTTPTPCTGPCSHHPSGRRIRCLSRIRRVNRPGCACCRSRWKGVRFRLPKGREPAHEDAALRRGRGQAQRLLVDGSRVLGPAQPPQQVRGSPTAGGSRRARPTRRGRPPGRGQTGCRPRSRWTRHGSVPPPATGRREPAGRTVGDLHPVGALGVRGGRVACRNGGLELVRAVRRWASAASRVVTPSTMRATISRHRRSRRRSTVGGRLAESAVRRAGGRWTGLHVEVFGPTRTGRNLGVVGGLSTPGTANPLASRRGVAPASTRRRRR